MMFNLYQMFIMYGLMIYCKYCRHVTFHMHKNKSSHSICNQLSSDELYEKSDRDTFILSCNSDVSPSCCCFYM